LSRNQKYADDLCRCTQTEEFGGEFFSAPGIKFTLDQYLRVGEENPKVAVPGQDDFSCNLLVGLL
jgi:hypothetical protein